jgi:site-specific DNA-methyltransferase (adenine-specific)
LACNILEKSLYYKDEWATIYCGDCRDILPELAKVDLVLTDPPYNVDKDYGEQIDDSLSQESYKNWCVEWFNLLPRPVYFTPGHFNLAMWFEIEAPKWVMAWFKDNQCSRTRLGSGFMLWEPILVYGEGQKVNQDAFYEPISIQSDTGNHPCPKNAKAWQKLITLISQPGNLILDPFLGSGTTCYCAKKLNRRSIGIEINEKYCEIAKKRLAQSVMVL